MRSTTHHHTLTTLAVASLVTVLAAGCGQGPADRRAKRAGGLHGRGGLEVPAPTSETPGSAVPGSSTTPSSTPSTGGSTGPPPSTTGARGPPAVECH